ncbi:LexA family transcriptional regulator [uncultured Roseibium sp.]|uniref:LexA family protein n=1 Tax=uncultured Roseibium sp. TaxID=1936171 RepID=UPI00261252E2|nr:LexA family transcriptional regulator [uncultured Roseibium sp.]
MVLSSNIGQTALNMDLNSNIGIGDFFQPVNSELEYLLEMTWNNRIVELRKEKKLSRAELARRADVNYDALNKSERGEVEQPRGDFLARIAQALGTTEQFLRYGSEGGGEQTKITPRGLVIRGEVAAGLWLEADLFEGEKEERSNLFGGDERYPADAQYLLRIKGESLNRIAQDGDLILCVDYLQAGFEIKAGDLIVVERSRDGGHTLERTAKRIIRHNGEIELRPESNDPRFQEPVIYDEHSEEASEVRILAKIIGVFRQF